MRRVALSILLTLVLLLLSGQAMAQPTAFVSSPAIYRLIINDCQFAPRSRVQTAFRVEGVDGLVTALHGVAGCADIKALNDDDDFPIEGLAIEWVDVQRDVAVISSPALGQAARASLKASDRYAPDDLQVIGYPYGRTQQIATQDIINVAKEPLNHMINGPYRTRAFLERASPDVEIKVLNLQANVLPGHSGAPLLTADRQVVGIVDGGLEEGAVGIAWAIPWEDIEWMASEEVEQEIDRLAQMDPGLALGFSLTVYTEDDVKEIPVPQLVSDPFNAYRFRMQASVDSLMGMQNLSGDVVFEGSYRKEEVQRSQPGRRPGSNTVKELRSLTATGSLVTALSGGLLPMAEIGYLVVGDDDYFLMNGVCIIPNQSTTALRQQMDDVYDTLLELMQLPMTSDVAEGTLLGEEVLHNTKTRHYLADPSSLTGLETDGGLIVNRAEFWIATPGNYLVKALLDLEAGSTTTLEQLPAKRIIANLEYYDIGAEISPPARSECVSMEGAGLPLTPATPNRPTAPTAPAAPSGVIQNVWADHNVEQAGQRGMVVHTAFTVNGLQGQTATVTAYFGYNYGLPLWDANGLYVAADGSVIVSRAVDLPYASTRYDDLSLFMPYDELHLSPGRHDLKVVVALHDPTNGAILAQSAAVDFFVEQDAAPTPAAPSTDTQRLLDDNLAQALRQLAPEATIHDVAIDHNVTVDGMQGMRLHVQFTINGLQDVPCQVSAYFAFADGDPLFDYNDAYHTVDGQVSTWVDMTPGYAETFYEDLQLFIPYSELHMAPGTHALRVHIEIHEMVDLETLAVSDYQYFTYRSE